MDSITDVLNRNIEKYGRAHWLLENTQARTTRLSETLESFKNGHPVSAFTATDGGELLVTYAARRGGWAIEAHAWRDPETNEVHQENEPRHILSARVTTRRPTAIGSIELRLSPIAREAPALFDQLSAYLIRQFTGATIRDMLAEREAEEKPYRDPGRNCHIQEEFTIPIPKVVLVNAMKKVGERAEQNGPERIGDYRLNNVPEVETVDAITYLTWHYSTRHVFDWWDGKHPGVQWQLKDNDAGTTEVAARCASEEFRSYYYRLKNLAERLQKDGETGQQKTQIPSQRRELAPVNIKTGGRPSLLANHWAYAETLLGRQPANLLQEWGQLYEKETGKRVADLDDPAKSLRQGIADMGKKYDKKLKS